MVTEFQVSQVKPLEFGIIVLLIVKFGYSQLITQKETNQDDFTVSYW